MTIHDPRIPLTEDDQADLRWFLQRDYVGDLGVRSNWEPCVQRAILNERVRRAARDALSWHEIPVRPVQSYRLPAVDEHVVQAAEDLRELEARWRRLDARHRGVLLTLFEASHRNPVGWGVLWPVVLRLPASARAHATARSQMSLAGWLEHIRSRPAKWGRLVARLEAEAQAYVDDACDAWRATLGERRQRRAA